MNLKLVRSEYLETGIYGGITSEDKLLFYTLEHAFSLIDGYYPKLPQGVYKCVKGLHKLEHSEPFETFEITDVVGHTGILFHSGNYNKDSDGCVLLGLAKGDDMVISSRLAFDNFMELQKDVSEFYLTVN